MKSCEEVLVDSPNDSKPLREIKQMLNLEKESSKNDPETKLHILSILLLELEMDLEEKRETVLLLTI